MAEFSFSGIDDLLLSLEEVAEIPDDVQDEMLNAGADVVVQAQKKATDILGIKRITGQMVDSISKGKPKTTKEGGRAIYVYSRGTRTRGKDKRVRNAEIAFINEFGTRSQVSRPFVQLGNEMSAEATTEAQAVVYDKFLKSKNL